MAAMRCPVCLHFHGTADTLIPPSESLDLHNALRAAGIDSTRYLVQGAGYGDLAYLGDPAAALRWTIPKVMGLMVGFFAAHLR